MAIKETLFLLLFITLPLATKTDEPLEIKSSGGFVEASTSMSEGSDETDTGICLKEEIKQEIEAIRKRLEELSAKAERCQGPCQPSWARHGKSYYYIDATTTKKWSDSRLKCQTIGADLAVITSEEENQFIVDLFKDRMTTKTVAAWIGLQRKSDSMFYWVDGTPLKGQYQNWANGEPNNAKGNEDTVFMKSGGEWNDDPRDLTRYSYWNDKGLLTLCEKPV